jgi:hypothetical protein
MALTDNQLDASRQLMQIAERELEEGNVELAAEKAAEAVDYRLTTMAQQRGWQYGWHLHHSENVYRLAKEVAQPKELKSMFAAAGNLRFSLHNEVKPVEFVRTEIDCVKRLLAMLEEVE